MSHPVWLHDRRSPTAGSVGARAAIASSWRCHHAAAAISNGNAVMRKRGPGGHRLGDQHECDDHGAVGRRRERQPDPPGAVDHRDQRRHREGGERIGRRRERMRDEVERVRHGGGPEARPFLPGLGLHPEPGTALAGGVVDVDLEGDEADRRQHDRHERPPVTGPPDGEEAGHHARRDEADAVRSCRGAEHGGQAGEPPLFAERGTAGRRPPAR